jgi:hypothetical protein
MTIVIVGHHEEIDALIERRRALGQDGSDEVWEGTYHMAPHASLGHSHLSVQISVHLYPLVHKQGLHLAAEFNLGEGPDSFRVPDFGVLGEVSNEVYASTAVMVGEILSPDDETYAKFPYYASHQVSEIVVIDPAEHAVKAFQLTSGGKYREVERITSCNLSCLRLAFLIDWP